MVTVIVPGPVPDRGDTTTVPPYCGRVSYRCPRDAAHGGEHGSMFMSAINCIAVAAYFGYIGLTLVDGDFSVKTCHSAYAEGVSASSHCGHRDGLFRLARIENRLL